MAAPRGYCAGVDRAVITVEKALADDLQRSADAYRAKDLFAYRMFNLTRLVVTRADASRTFEKKKTGSGSDATDTWVQAAPADANVTAATIDDIARVVTDKERDAAGSAG